MSGMYLENLVVDAVVPQRLGRFWEAVVGGETLTHQPEGFETRLQVPGGPVLDLCFQPVPDAATQGGRIRVALAAGPDDARDLSRLIDLGAALSADAVDSNGAQWLVDPEGQPFCVVPVPDAALCGPISAIRLESADPEHDRLFWGWLTGWTDVERGGAAGLRHPAGRGPVLEFHAEGAAKATAKNRMHLDIRLEAGDDPDDIAAGITARGGSEWSSPWGPLPWRLFADPSGNEFCVLPARA